MTSPEVSVVMSVYNGETHLYESIESILNQTFRDFEFIILNDGSTDRSKDIINAFAVKESRIVAIHQENMGLACSLNKGIRMAKGNYVARQDADDVSFPERFAKQIAFLERYGDVVLCGTWFEEVNENNGKKIRKYPVEDITLRKNLKYINQFCHPSVVFKKIAFFQAGAYDEAFATGQDFELWVRLAEQGKIANIPEVCVKKRIGFENTISWQKRKAKIFLWNRMFEKHFNSDIRKINLPKFAMYYLPLLVYGYVPVRLLKIIRIFRYR